MMTKKSVAVASVVFALTWSAASVNGSDNPNPYLQPNNTWISISGTVDTVTADSFILDFGEGLVTVEMDDGDRDADGYKLLKGDKVTVNGMVDDDFYETTSIEAGSVYVEKLNTYFYASSIDDEDFDATIWYTYPVVVGEVTVQGAVSEINGEEFKLTTGLNSITVDVGNMPFNPLDDVGYVQIDKGDIVRVNGTAEQQFFNENRLSAQNLVVLSQ